MDLAILNQQAPGAVNQSCFDRSRRECEGLPSLVRVQRETTTQERRERSQVREQIERHHQKTIAAALPGPLAAQRAGVMLSLIAGFQLMRQMLELSALAKADAKTLVKVLAPVFDRLLQ